MVTEQVYGGAKAQTNFSNSHPPTFHNTKSWRLIIDHRKKKTGMLITPMKEHSTAGNEEIAPSGGSRGRRKGRRKASYGRDWTAYCFHMRLAWILYFLHWLVWLSCLDSCLATQVRSHSNMSALSDGFLTFPDRTNLESQGLKEREFAAEFFICGSSV